MYSSDSTDLLEPTQTSIARVRSPKNQLLQIDPPTIVGCSLWYPIARSTMTPEAQLLSSQKYRFQYFVMQNLFLKFCAPHKGANKTCYLARYYPELL